MNLKQSFRLWLFRLWSPLSDLQTRIKRFPNTNRHIYSTAQTNVSLSFSQCNWKFLGPKRPPSSVIQTSICYLNTWVALLLSLQQQNPNTIFSALTSKRLELITLAKDKIPSYCSFSFRKLIQALALKKIIKNWQCKLLRNYWFTTCTIASSILSFNLRWGFR